MDKKTSFPSVPDRVRLPDERESITHRFVIRCGYEDFIASGKTDDNGNQLYKREIRDLNGYLTVGMYDDGKPGELFMKIGKAGGLWQVYDSLMIAISVGLQYGIPIEVFINKFEHMRFEPNGQTVNKEIPLAKSIADYLAKWLKMKYIVDKNECSSNGETSLVRDAFCVDDDERWLKDDFEYCGEISRGKAEDSR